MNTHAILRNLSSIAEMIGLRDRALREGDFESQHIARMLSETIERTRRDIREAVSQPRLKLLERNYPVLTAD